MAQPFSLSLAAQFRQVFDTFQIYGKRVFLPIVCNVSGQLVPDTCAVLALLDVPGQRLPAQGLARYHSVGGDRQSLRALCCA